MWGRPPSRVLHPQRGSGPATPRHQCCGPPASDPRASPKAFARAAQAARLQGSVCLGHMERRSRLCEDLLTDGAPEQGPLLGGCEH